MWECSATLSEWLLTVHIEAQESVGLELDLDSLKCRDICDVCY